MTTKTAQIPPIRIEPELYAHLRHAAHFDRRSFASFMTHAAIQYSESLRMKGWKAKPAPQPRDARRKAA